MGFHDSVWGHKDERDEMREEIERLTVENWQLKRALGYPVPAQVVPTEPDMTTKPDVRTTEKL